jgi:hypothetical protein
MKTDHVIFDTSSSRVKCLFCGESCGFRLPMLVKDFCKRCKAFATLHKDCQKGDTK